MTTFNTNSDFNEHSRQMDKARHVAEAKIWQMTDLLSIIFAPKATNSEGEFTKSARRGSSPVAV
ncbi:MAG: hypothetical protein ACJAVT_001374 [Yoonia sp.]|jgi:hypothetical protein